MKQTLLSILMLGLALSAGAQTTVTTVANGNATNPATWDCLCIPADGDSIIINHALVLDADFALTSGAIIVNPAGSVTGNVNNRILAIGGGGFRNDGTFTLAYIYHSGGSFYNNNVLTATRNLGVDVSAQAVNNGTMNVNDTLLINTNASIINTGSMIVPEIGCAGGFVNSGSVLCDNLANTGVYNNNLGSTNVAMTVFNVGTVTNNTPMVIGGDFYNTENVTNNSFISCSSLYNGDTVAQTAVFTNNGTISVSADFANSRTVNGTGHFCVAGTSTNAGAMNGTIDFCDLTGGTIDLNVGTVAGTVTFCSTPCALGVDEQFADNVNMYPNPVIDHLTVQLPGNTTSVVRITNSLGQEVMVLSTTESLVTLPLNMLASGVYSISVQTGDRFVASRFVKN